MELNNFFFSFPRNPLGRSGSYVISEKSKNRYFKDTFTHGASTLLIMKKQKTLQLLLIIENTHNKQKKI